jgi:hypothetical protein
MLIRKRLDSIYLIAKGMIYYKWHETKKKFHSNILKGKDSLRIYSPKYG